MKWRAWLAGAALASGLGGAAQAAEELPPPARPDKGDLEARKLLMREVQLEAWKSTGVIKAVNTTNKTLTVTGSNGQIVCAITEGTRLTRAGTPLALNDLKPGEQVLLYCRGPEARSTAITVRVLPPRDEKKMAEKRSWRSPLVLPSSSPPREEKQTRDKQGIKEKKKPETR